VTSEARPRPARDERGVATVVAVGLMGLLLSVTVVAAGGTRVAVASHRAGAAADLAALAAAQAAQSGSDACAAAASVARANSGRVTACVPDGLAVRVTVTVDTPRMVGLLWSVPASARAGPLGAG
jgi:secretion/DNA translocation related TadE-like protein